MTVSVEYQDDMAIVTLNRPERLNALNDELVTDLHAALGELDDNLSIRAVVLTGAGRAFCAGLDLKGYGDDDRVQRDGEMIRTFERQREIADLVTRVRDLRHPVIAAVNGAATGGGLALVLASDIRIASTEAKFAVSFIRAGYSACDIGTSWLLPRLVGVGRAHELMLTGRTFDAEAAYGYGLVTDLVDPDELMPTARRTVEMIALNAPFSVELTKAGMWSAVETTTQRASIDFENRQQMVSAFTADRGESTAAFLEKRPARYVRR